MTIHLFVLSFFLSIVFLAHVFFFYLCLSPSSSLVRHSFQVFEDNPGHEIRGTYGAFSASCGYRTVSKFARNTSRAFTLEYCAKTAVYGAILEQNARFRPIYSSLRRCVMINVGKVTWTIYGLAFYWKRMLVHSRTRVMLSFCLSIGISWEKGFSFTIAIR